jgi:hypothetical protein
MKCGARIRLVVPEANPPSIRPIDMSPVLRQDRDGFRDSFAETSGIGEKYMRSSPVNTADAYRPRPLLRKKVLTEGAHAALSDNAFPDDLAATDRGST